MTSAGPHQYTWEEHPGSPQFTHPRVGRGGQMAHRHVSVPWVADEPEHRCVHVMVALGSLRGWAMLAPH